MSNALSATTVAKDSSIVTPISLDKIYALTGSPPPLPIGVMLLAARPTRVIGSNFLILKFISAILAIIRHLKVYK